MEFYLKTPTNGQFSSISITEQKLGFNKSLATFIPYLNYANDKSPTTNVDTKLPIFLSFIYIYLCIHKQS